MKQLPPVLFISDSPNGPTGLGMITRELATNVKNHLSDVCYVGIAGYGDAGENKQPFPVYPFSELRNWTIPQLPWIWKQFAGDRKGVLCFVWNIAWLNWLAYPERLEPGELRDFLMSDRFKLWCYVPVDSVCLNDKLSSHEERILRRLDRVLAYTKFGADAIDRTLGNPLGTTEHIPHGTDDKIFFPRSRKAARETLLERIGLGKGGKIGDDVIIVGCVEQGTVILTPNGEVPVESIKVGDEVFAGSLKSIVVGVQNPRIPKEGELYELHAQGMCKSLRVTEEHPILCVPRERISCTQTKAWNIKGYACRPWQRESEHCGRCWNWEEMDWEPEFKPVSTLVPGDFLALPIPCESHSETVIDAKRFSEGLIRPGKYNLPDAVEVTPDLAFVIGLWAAEGSFQKQTRNGGKRIRYGLVFTLNAKEKYLLERIKDALEPLGCKVLSYNFKDNEHHKNTLDIQVSGRGLSELFYECCGEGAKTKKFSRWIMELNPELQRHVLAGFVAGDGHIRKDITHKITAATASHQLARQIWLMALRCGEPAGLHYSANVSPYTGRPGGCYFVTFYTETRRVEKDSRRTFIYNGIFYTPIIKVGKTKTTGKPVFDLSVLGVHQYIANGICVHNCFATNTSRKDFPLALEVCGRLVQKGHKIGVLIHTNRMVGDWNITELCHGFGLQGRVFESTKPLADHREVAWLYAACDVVLCPGRGEGWGSPCSEALACGVPIVTGNYAGSMEFVPPQYAVDPIAYQYESVFSNKRPVHDPELWVERVEKFLLFRDTPRKPLLGKEWMWPQVWPLWEKWFRDGFEGKKPERPLTLEEKLGRVRALNYDHHRRMTEDHNRIKAEEALHPENTKTRDNLDDTAFRSMLASIPKGGKILELGSASGAQWHLLREWSDDLTGIDLFEPAVIESQKNGLNIHLGFVEQMPFENESFDLVCSRHVMEHVADIQLALSEINRVLRPGGYVAAATPHYWHDIEPAHINKLHIEEWVKEYEEAGLKIISANLYECFDQEAHIVARKEEC